MWGEGEVGCVMLSLPSAISVTALRVDYLVDEGGGAQTVRSWENAAAHLGVKKRDRAFALECVCYGSWVRCMHPTSS